MTENPTGQIPTRLVLRSRLEELAKVFPWIEALGEAYAFPSASRFAINLCLEEALSNVVRHGYCGSPDQSITVRFESHGERQVSFVVEDSAPHFHPPLPLEVEAPPALEDMVPGGNGIRLMRKFSDALEWEPLQRGNRLVIRFVIPEAG